MKTKGSKRFQIDRKGVQQILNASLLGVLAFYVSNIDALNTMINDNVGPQASAIIIMVLGYAAKKYLTDYSKK